VDALLSECRCLPAGPKFTARPEQVSLTLTIPADALTVLLEILKFLGTLALMLVTALILLMAG